MAGPKIRPGKGPGGGPASALMPGEKAKDFKGTIKTLWRYLRPYRGRLIISSLATVFSVAFSVISPLILGKATDVVANSVLHNVPMDFTALIKLLVLLLIIYGLSSVFSALLGFVMAGISQRVSYRLRNELSEKLNRLPLEYFDKKTHGEILSRVTNDIDTVNTTLNQTLSQIVTSLITVVGILLLMIYISPLMTLIALITIPLSMFVIKMIVKRSQGHFRDNQMYLGEVNGHIEEMFTAHIVVKAFNGQEEAKKTFDELNGKLEKAGRKSQFYSGTMMPLINFVGNIGFVLVCIVGGYLAVNGRITIGSIQAFLQYIRTFNQPLMQLANIANVLQSTAAASERVFEVLNEEDEAPDSDTPEVILKENVKGDIVFDNVTFSYPLEEENRPPLMKNLSFSVKQGQRVAIVGPTGAGKTTIVKLLLRFYELKGGRILLDGVDIKDMKRGDLRSCFSMVLQDNWLFSGTVQENISYCCDTATKEDIKKAAKAAHIHHYIRTQPKGYKMVVQEDAGNLSAGQKQLLTLARAFLADSPILILDEATSSVDTRTEKNVQRAMAELMKGRTSFIIAHRLSTIVDADIILVMKDGDVIEKGTHKELLEAKGFYKNLYDSQYK